MDQETEQTVPKRRAIHLLLQNAQLHVTENLVRHLIAPGRAHMFILSRIRSAAAICTPRTLFSAPLPGGSQRSARWHPSWWHGRDFRLVPAAIMRTLWSRCSPTAARTVPCRDSTCKQYTHTHSTTAKAFKTGGRSRRICYSSRAAGALRGLGRRRAHHERRCSHVFAHARAEGLHGVTAPGLLGDAVGVGRCELVSTAAASGCVRHRGQLPLAAAAATAAADILPYSAPIHIDAPASPRDRPTAS